MEDIEKTLEEFSIRNTSSKAKGNSLPAPGSPIPQEWYDALDMNFLNNYEESEYVGFKKNLKDDMYYYAVIVERLGKPGETGPCCKYRIQIGEDEFIEVSSLDLYQFKRGKRNDSNPCQVLECVNGHAPSSKIKTEFKADFPKTFEEVKQDIDRSLKEIRKLPEDEQHKAVRRLYLRWHPDKNPGQEELANEAFKYLMNKIESQKRNGSGDGSSHAGTFRGNKGTARWNFKDFYDDWNSEASRHRQGRENFYQRNNRSQYNFWSYHQEMPKPDREEANRWYSQAKCDLKAAGNDTDKESTEWCLFKIHQAVEKALIAAEYRYCGKQSSNSSILSLALKVSSYSSELRTLPDLVRRLKQLDVDAKKTQYPNYHPLPKIPNNTFLPENEKKALELAEEVLRKISDYVEY